MFHSTAAKAAEQPTLFGLLLQLLLMVLMTVGSGCCCGDGMRYLC
jgi:hypothetical protein